LLILNGIFFIPAFVCYSIFVASQALHLSVMNLALASRFTNRLLCNSCTAAHCQI